MRVDGDKDATGLEGVHRRSLLESVGLIEAEPFTALPVPVTLGVVDFVLCRTRNESFRGRNGDARGSVSSQMRRFWR